MIVCDGEEPQFLGLGANHVGVGRAESYIRVAVTIHELANRAHAQLSELPSDEKEWKTFPPDQTDVLVSPDHNLVIAINRITGLFAAQRGSIIVTGNTENELPSHHVAQLLR